MREPNWSLWRFKMHRIPLARLIVTFAAQGCTIIQSRERPYDRNKNEVCIGAWRGA
jgi:hypothetical protein